MKPTGILLPKDLLDEPPHVAAQAVVDYVNVLREQLWTDEEIPEVAWAIYYADYYLTEVENGGHSQFLYNARPRELVVRLAEEGLRMVGAQRIAEILAEALALVAAEPELLERLTRAQYFGASRDVAPRFAEVDEALWSVPDDMSWLTLCHRWLRDSPEVERLDRDAYDARLEALAEAVPDREARRRAAEEAYDAAMPPYEKRIREACRARALEYDRLTAGVPRPGGVVEWSFLASGTRRVAVVRGGTLVRIVWAPLDRTLWSDLLARFGIGTGL